MLLAHAETMFARLFLPQAAHLLDSIASGHGLVWPKEHWARTAWARIGDEFKASYHSSSTSTELLLLLWQSC